MMCDPRETLSLPTLPARPTDSHKGTYGRVLIAAGSPFMPGAAALAAKAAYRSGAGLVTVLTDPEAIPAVSASVVEAIFIDWTEIGRSLALRTGDRSWDAVLVGPGLGLADRGRLVLDLVRATSAPIVLDADALNLIAEEKPALDPSDRRIWTPHPGEFLRLTGETPSGDEERLAAARRFVAERGGVLVLKGHHTIVMDASRYAVNTTGNPGLATAGSGDVLVGMLVAFLGQNLEPFDAARLAVHLHGLAGDLVADLTGPMGQVSLCASDLIEYLPLALQRHANDTCDDT